MSDDRRRNCFHCKHYFVTWNPATPRGCRIYGIQSADMPSKLVAQSTNEACLGFLDKRPQKAKELDLNDDELWKDS